MIFWENKSGKMRPAYNGLLVSRGMVGGFRHVRFRPTIGASGRSYIILTAQRRLLIQSLRLFPVVGLIHCLSLAREGEARGRPHAFPVSTEFGGSIKLSVDTA